MYAKQLEYNELSRLVERFKIIIFGRAVGEFQDEEEYYRIRNTLVVQKAVKQTLPSFIESCKSLSDYWAFISSKSSTYAGRRQFLREAFEPINWAINELKSRGIVGEDPTFQPERTNPLSNEFITEQLSKAEAKLVSEDFSGSITNSRALVEQVLLALQHRLPNCGITNDGDIGKMYKAVQKALHLDPGEKELETQLRQILSGLTSIVNGLGAVRNAAGDAHARTYNPAKHHARLALNASKTLTAFLFETYEYQLERGLIPVPKTITEEDPS